MQEIQKLSARHLRMMRLVLLGVPQNQIARMLGIHVNTVAIVVASPIFQAEYARRQANLEEQSDEEIIAEQNLAATFIQNAAMGAALKVDELAHHAAEESVQLRAAEIILKTAFSREPPPTNQMTNIFVLDPNQMKALMTVAKEAGLLEQTKQVEATVV